jgi:hypothetical protein
MARSVVRGLVLGLFASALLGLAAQPAHARDDTATACGKAANTVSGGLQTFVGQIQQVQAQAGAGDLVGAEASVKQAGATLQGIGSQLTAQNSADSAQLKQTINELGAEFTSLGTQLSSLSSLQTFDTSRLEQIGNTMTSLCGPLPTPSGSAMPFTVPSAAPSRTS